MLRLSLICTALISAALGLPRVVAGPLPRGAAAPLESGDGPDRLGPDQANPQGQPEQAPVHLERELLAMGCRLRIELEAADRAQALAASQAAFLALKEVEARLSTWDPNSELSRFHSAPAGRLFALSERTQAELERAWSWSSWSQGAFDPRLGALVSAYDLRGRGRWPSPAELQAARSHSGPLALQLLPGGLLRQSAEARLEEGAFAKGAGLDAALEALRAAGIASARLDLGGQLAFLKPQKLSIAEPGRRERALLTLQLTAGSLATSDNTLSARQVDGRLLPHLIDPRSGLPATDWGSLCVWASSALDADALSTGLYVLGPEAALERAESDGRFEVLTIERRAALWHIRLSSGLAQAIESERSDVRFEVYRAPSGDQP